MATRHKHRNWLAYFKEATVCLGPADWAVSGIPIDHISVDMSGIKSTYVEDPSLEHYGQQVNSRQILEGARNIELKFGTTLTGIGVVAAADTQAEANAMTDLMEYALGGAHYSNTTEVTGGTALEPEVDDVTNIAVGQLIMFEDTTTPAKVNQTYWRKVVAIDALALTLDCALPFTPAAGDNVYGVGTFYIDEEILETAVASNKTLSWYIKRHPTDPHMTWEARGCVHTMAISSIERNAPPKLEFSVMGGNYKHSDEDGLVNVDFATEQFGFAPLATPRLRCNIASGTSHNYCNVSSFALDLGVGRSPVQTITETINTFEGLGDYTVKFSNSELTVVITDFDAVWYAGIKAGTSYNVTLYQGAKGAGKSWCIRLNDCELVETPSMTEIDEALGVQLKFRAKPNDAGESNMEVSRVLIGIG
jgi:hypothetical protein